MRGKKGVLHNLGVLAAGQVAAQLLNVIALVYLARTLGSHWFGVVQVGVAFSAYALIAAEWGLMTLGIREIARLDRPGDILGYARLHLGMLSVQAVVVLGVGVLVLQWLPFYAEDHLVFLLYLAIVIPQVFMLDWVGIGLEQMTWVGVTKIVRSLIYALLVLLLLKRLTGVLGLAAQQWVPLMFLCSFVGSNLVIGIPVARWLGQVVTPRFADLREWRRRWRESGPIGANVVTMRVLLNIDIIMLGMLAAPAVAGAYAAASRVIFLLVIAMEVLWKALLPRLSRLAAESTADFIRTFNLYLGLVLAGLLPVAVGGFWLGSDLVARLYGNRWPDAGTVFSVLSISYTFLSLGWYLGNSLVARDLQHRFFRPLVASAILALVANAVLVPRLGAVGACLGMLAAHALLLGLLVVICRDQFRRELLHSLRAIVPALGGLAVVLLLTDGWPAVGRVAAAGTVYVALVGYPLLRWSISLRSPAPSDGSSDRQRPA